MPVATIGLIAVTAGLFIAPRSVEAGTPSIWSTATEVSGSPGGSGNFTAVSCTRATDCTAVGEDGNDQPFYDTETDGSWGTPTQISGSPGGSGSFAGVSCTGANDCTAVGEDRNAAAFYDTETDGSWGAPTQITGTTVGYDAYSRFSGVSCTSATQCTAVGAAGDNRLGLPIYATETGGVWGAAARLSGEPLGQGWLYSVSCTGATNCTAVGGTGVPDCCGTAPTYATETDGTWGAPTEISGGSNILTGVSCPSAADCTAVGGDGSDAPAFYATETNGTWGPATGISSSTLGSDEYSRLTSVSCPSATNCTAVGRDGYANETDGTWGPVTEISGFAGGSGVSCTDAKDCTAVGAVGYDGGADGSGEPIYATSQPEPTASILIPSNGATLSGSTYLDAAASDATSVEFRLLGGPYGLNAPAICTATPTLYGWLCSWNTDTVPNGSYILESEASNSAGSTFSSGVGITVKNPLPTTSVLIPSIGATLSGSTYLDASASNATSVEYWILGGSFGFTGKLIGIATPTIYGWLCPWNTTMVPDGSYVLVSEAFNTAGSSFSSWVGITVKN